MRDLSVCIAARNEQFLQNTIDDVLSNAEADTEVIVVLDGYEPDPPIRMRGDRRLTLIYEAQPIGQRGGINKAARYSNAKYMMKLDAHCAVDKGFDRKLITEGIALGEDVTQIPRMYHFHVFDWECEECGERYYQADPVPTCKCGGQKFKQTMVWTPRWNKIRDFARFDSTLHFQYWRRYGRRPESKGDVVDVMSSIGACWFMSRNRFLELEGLDEGHGFWGQVGTEVACKSWLSGGRQVVNKRTWFAHFFRVGKLKFPYHITGEQQEAARVYSRMLWFGNGWAKAVRQLKWLVDKFSPVPGWEDFDWSSV